MQNDSAEVGRYYDHVIFEIELDRLSELSPVEFAMTVRYLERHIPAGATVAEIGVGGGQYSELLAARGCRLHLIDVSRKLLNEVHSRLPDATAHHASATDLPLADASCGAVLMLGPLYHLTRLEDRRRAVAEAARILKPGGMLFAAGINRLAYLRDAFRMWPETVIDRRDFHAGYLRDGVLNPEIAPPIGHAHLTTREEFAALFPPAFRQIKLAAVESFVSSWQTQIKSFPKDRAEAWLDLVEQTAELPEAFGIGDHYLYIGERIP